MRMRAGAIGVLLVSAWTAAPGTAGEAKGCDVRLANVDASHVATFRGECAWRVAPAYVTAVLTDPQRMAAISSALEESRRLPDGRIVNVQKTGWPMDERQSTLEVIDEPRPDGGVLRTFRLARVQEPAAPGRVQVGVDEGNWSVSAAPGGGTRIVLNLRYEPGGNMPPSLVQKMSPQFIARGLDELRGAAEQLARSPAASAGVASGPPSGR